MKQANSSFNSSNSGVSQESLDQAVLNHKDLLSSKIKAEFGNHVSIDEKLFSFGVEHGRFLERNGVVDCRLPCFIEQEIANTEASNKSILITKVQGVLLDFVMSAFVAEIDAKGSIELNASFNTLCKPALSDKISQQFCISHSSTREYQEAGCLTVTLLVHGRLEELFLRHNLPTLLELEIESEDGESSIFLSDIDDLYRSFRRVRLNNYVRSKDFTSHQLETFSIELMRHLFILLSQSE